MSSAVAQQIQALADLETKGWNRKNPDLFLSIIHPDMAWPWPPTPEAHDPAEWVFVLRAIRSRTLAQQLAEHL